MAETLPANFFKEGVSLAVEMVDSVALLFNYFINDSLGGVFVAVCSFGVGVAMFRLLESVLGGRPLR